MINSTLLIPIGSWLIEKIADKGFDSVIKTLTDADHEKRFYKIVESTSIELQDKYPYILGGSIDYFFKQKEVFGELIKLLFIDAKLDITVIENNFDTKSLPKDFILEFIITLRKNLYADNVFSPILSNKELFYIILGIHRNLNELLNISTITAEEIKNIYKVLTKKLNSAFDVNKFKLTYFSNALNNLSQVNFIGLGVDLTIKKGKRKKINDIFVKPTFLVRIKNSNDVVNDEITEIEEDEEIDEFEESESTVILDYNNFLKTNKNIVILGNPGSGKSFLLKSIICDIIDNKKTDFRLLLPQDLIPFRIELRKYLSYKKENGTNLLAYLSYLLATEYSIENTTDEIIETILSSSPIMMLFDGLDEIFNVSHRIEIKNDIENFIRKYNCSYSITTSRIIGYEDACFDDKEMIRYHIQAFNDNQVKEYIEKWYSVEEEDVLTRNKEIAEFISKKNNLDEELIRNPLLLSLIVILYRNNLKVPESKLEIYQSCTSTLVDKWDAEKKLNIELDLEVYKRKEAILADLAYWQYKELSSNNPSNIKFEKAKSVVASTIQNKLKLADEFTSNEIANNFMEYAEKRSIYFDNNFTHKTFLEYFTAFWIYTNIEKKHKKTERDNLIGQYINNQFWHIVLELLINLIDKDQADNEIIDELINNQLQRPNHSLKLLLNILPSLNNISNNQIANIFKTTLHYLINNNENKSASIKRQLFESFKSFFNKDKYDGILIKSISEYSEHLNTKQKNELCLILMETLVLSPDAIQIENQIIEILESNSTNIELDSTLYKFYLVIFKQKIETEPVKYLLDYLQKFGIKELYNREKLKFSSYSLYPLFSLIARRLFYTINLPSFEQNLSTLAKNGFNLTVIINNIIDQADAYVWSDVDISDIIKLYNKTTPVKLKTILELYILIYIIHYDGRKMKFNISETINCIDDKTAYERISEYYQTKKLEVSINVFCDFYEIPKKSINFLKPLQ